jgi:hypothetical protein
VETGDDGKVCDYLKRTTGGLEALLDLSSRRTITL